MKNEKKSFSSSSLYFEISFTPSNLCIIDYIELNEKVEDVKKKVTLLRREESRYDSSFSSFKSSL